MAVAYQVPEAKRSHILAGTWGNSNSDTHCTRVRV